MSSTRDHDRARPHGRSAPSRRTRIVLVLAATLPLLTAVAAVQPAAPAARDMVLFAVLNGGQETGGSVSNAFGVAHLTFDPSSRMLCYSINYTDLAGDETGAHFHGPARAGEDAGILFDISSPEGSPKEGCVGPLSGKEANLLKRGRIYINVHSTAAPAGEIRGQVGWLSKVK